MIPDTGWAYEYKLRQTHFKHLYKDFLKTKVKQLTNILIVDPIIEEMRAQGVHEKIYQTVVLERVVITDVGISLRIHSEYFADNGFDVAMARELGTEDHMIRPKNKFALSWIQDGKRRFSLGHKVSGLPRLNIIERKIEEGEYALQERLNNEFAAWKKDIFS